MKKRLYEYLIYNNVKIDQDVFDYGFSYFKSYMIYLIITIPFIILFKLYINIALFLILYIPLRKYLGGYHFNNNLVCVFFSSFISILVSYYSSIYNIPYVYYLASSIIVLFLTIFIAPIEHANKKLNSYEKRIYKFKAIKIEIIFILLSIIIYTFFKKNFISILFYINIINICNLIIGKSFNRNHK